MASLEQIVISGIRSFNPDTSARQGIRLQKPVTIILGPNGSGKTTVIECLRNACTGEVPVNTGKGAAFIHDPKVAGETEVKGQIKLQFRTASGQQMLIGRSYQLTQMSDAKQRFSTLDVSLQTRDPKSGQVVSQSYKCSDIDKLVPDLLGITKPILDNVIFLHQDETNWPLADAAKLKKNFDDIFSSTRYTKALEELRKVMKENREKAKEHIANLAVFKEKRGAAHVLRSQIEETQKKIQTTHEHINGINAKLEKIESRVAETSRQADEIQQLESSTIKLQGEVEALVRQREAMGQNLRVVSKESDEGLSRALVEFDARIAKLLRSVGEQEAQLRARVEEQQRDEERAVRLKSERAYLVSCANEHERRLASLQGIIKTAAADYGIPAPAVTASGVDEKGVLSFVAAFEGKTAELKIERDRTRTETRARQSEIEAQLSQKRQARDKLALALNAAGRENEAIRPRLRDHKDRYNSMSAAEDELSAAVKACEELQTELHDRRMEEGERCRHLEELREKHDDLQIAADALRIEAQSRKNEQQAAHKLTMYREEKDRLAVDAASIMNDMGAKFRGIVGRQLKANALEDTQQAYAAKQRASQGAQKQFATAERDKAFAQRKLAEVRGRADELAQELKDKESRYAGHEAKHGRTLPELLHRAEAREEKERKAVATLQALQTCHDKFTEQAEEDGACPICSRGMSETELSVMHNTMRDKLKNVPSSIASKEESLRKTQKLVKEIRALMPVYHDTGRVRAEIAELQKQELEWQGAIDTHSETVTDAAARVEALRLEEAEMEAVRRMADRHADVCAKIAGVVQNIEEEEARVASRLGKGARPLDLVERELERTQATCRDINAAQQRAMQDLDTVRSAVGSLHQRMNVQQRNADEKQAKMRERDRLKATYDADLEKYQQNNKDIAEMNAKVPQLEATIRALEDDLTTARSDGDAHEHKLTKQVELHQSALSNLHGLVVEVKKHVEQRRDAMLKEVTRTVAELDEAQRQRKHQVDMLEQQVQECRATVAKQDATKRELQANVEYRRMCEEVRTREAELMRLNQIIGERTKGHQGVWASLDKLREERGVHENERATFQGHLEAMETLLVERQRELRSPKYDRIDERYNSTLIRLATTQLAEEDLGKYALALDCALMKYHDEKINEINAIIRDFWIRTYRGQDIDHIEIRTDVEAGSTRRSYNYRVVMIKHGVALDMRGRCSAGQKVLACLIVRLALSQAFCCDCGILALDEPTTNLDIENIDSLAYALTEIIQSRRGQSNFQLIIITHDEQFVRRIGHACGTETVFHISKGSDGQHSTITARSFAEMT